MRERNEGLKAWRLPAYVGAVAVAALAFVGAVAVFDAVPNPVEVAFFWALYAAAHWHPVEMPMPGVSGSARRPPTLSAGFLVLMTAAFATDPATAAVVGMLSPLVPRNWRGPLRTAFNGAQGAIYTGSAAVLFALIRDATGQTVWGFVLAAVLAALVAVSMNVGFVSGAMALERRWSLSRAWRTLSWPAPHSLAFAVAGLLVAMLYRQSGMLAAVFLLTPLLVLRQIRRAKGEIDLAHERTLRAFVRAVELKDPYTSRHSERVAAIAAEIHGRLDVGEKDLKKRYYGCLLHDIGKIAVSGRILAKSGPLTRDELDAIKVHPGLGAEVVEEIDFLAELSAEIRHHHERVDGTGYPDGLSGDEIPFDARVLAVADTFEALTSDRPYRRALSYGEAIGEMRRVAGTQLDASLVAVLEEILRDGVTFPVVVPERPDVAEPARAGSAGRT